VKNPSISAFSLGEISPLRSLEYSGLPAGEIVANLRTIEHNRGYGDLISSSGGETVVNSAESSAECSCAEVQILPRSLPIIRKPNY